MQNILLTVPAKMSNNSYDFLTKDLINSALEKQFGNNAQLTSYEVKDFTKPGDNFASAVTSIKVKCPVSMHDCLIFYDKCQ